MQKNKNNEAGKGDTYRPVNRKVYNENYDFIFRKTPLLVDFNNFEKILKILKERYNYRVTTWEKHEVHLRIGLKRPDGSLVDGYGINDGATLAQLALIESCQNAVNELKLTKNDL